MNRHQFRNSILFSLLMVAGACTIVVSLETAEGRVITVGRTGANYTVIEDALYFAQDGDTVRVLEGSYFENIVINRSITMEGAGAESTKIDALRNGHVVTIIADNVSFSGFKITGSGGEGFAGILVKSSGNRIMDNNVTDNPFGISLIESNNNRILNNTCSLSDGKGILLDHASYNTIEWNTCWMNGDGIYLYHSFFNTIANNTCSVNDMGIELYRSDHNTVDRNILTSNRYYGLHPLTSHFNTITENHCLFNEVTGILVSDSITNMLVGNDRDQDRVLDEQDAFLDDPAASSDSDGDGYPDAWNPNMTAEESWDGLSLDHFPDDPAASLDSDGDGYPDAWNIGSMAGDSITGLSLDTFPDDPDEWKDSDGDGYGDNEDDFPNTSYLHSYYRFFGTVFLIIGVSVGGHYKRKSMLQADCRLLLRECGQKQDEARFLRIPFGMDGFINAEALFEQEEYASARKQLLTEKQVLTGLLNDHHLSLELIEFVKNAYEWADENGFDYHSEHLARAEEEQGKGHYRESIRLSRRAFKEIKRIKDKLEELDRHMKNAQTEMSMARRSVSLRDIEPTFQLVQELYDDRKLDQASVLLDKMMIELQSLRRTTRPELSLIYQEGRGVDRTGDWSWIPVSLRNDGMAHARNIRMTAREGSVTLKHEKIHELVSGEERETEIALKLSDGYKGSITVLTTFFEQTLETKFESETVLELPVHPIEGEDYGHEKKEAGSEDTDGSEMEETEQKVSKEVEGAETGKRVSKKKGELETEQEVSKEVEVAGTEERVSEKQGEKETEQEVSKEVEVAGTEERVSEKQGEKETEQEASKEKGGSGSGDRQEGIEGGAGEGNTHHAQ